MHSIQAVNHFDPNNGPLSQIIFNPEQWTGSEHEPVHCRTFAYKNQADGQQNRKAVTEPVRPGLIKNSGFYSQAGNVYFGIRLKLRDPRYLGNHPFKFGPDRYRGWGGPTCG